MQPDPTPGRVAQPEDLTSPPRPAAARRARPGLIVLAAVLTELALVAGLCNQAVTTSLANYVAGRPALPDYTLGTVRSVATFGWSFAPLHGESSAVWGAQFAAIGVLLALTAVLVLAVCRGSVTFVRVFFAVWAVAAAAVPIAVIVGGLTAGPSQVHSNTSRLGDALFHDVDGAVSVAGLALGLVVGLVAAIVAVTTRRQAPLPVPPREADEAAEVYSTEQLPIFYRGQPFGQPLDQAFDQDAQQRSYPPSPFEAPRYEGPATEERIDAPPATAPTATVAPTYASARPADAAPDYGPHSYGSRSYGSRPWQQAGPDHAASVNAETSAVANSDSGSPRGGERPGLPRPGGDDGGAGPDAGAVDPPASREPYE